MKTGLTACYESFVESSKPYYSLIKSTKRDFYINKIKNSDTRGMFQIVRELTKTSSNALLSTDFDQLTNDFSNHFTKLWQSEGVLM